jgi:1-phosphatidylinositol-3-phosphate 5-kinase
MSPVKNPMSQIGGEEENDSDSTIGAKRELPAKIIPEGPDRFESSEMDSDANAFVSRLPRRTRPAARSVLFASIWARADGRSIADLVKRFQETSAGYPYEPIEEVPADRPRSAASLRRSHRSHERRGSESDEAGPSARPRLRRGKTEQAPARYRPATKPALHSDGDRSYAANASRIPSLHGSSRIGLGMPLERRSSGRTKATGTAGSTSPAVGRASPDISGRLTPAPALSRQNSSSGADGKARSAGKGKSAQKAEPRGSGRTSPAPIPSRPGVRRTIGGSSRVTSIARHFDRISREAERERQKRISAVRGKRARPVVATKAKVQVFDNLRDAFRDEFDTDSSEADNEEDDKDQASDDSADSAGNPKIPRKHRSPVKKVSPLKKPTEPIDVIPSTSSDSISTAVTEDLTASMSQSSSLAATSIMSDTRSEMSFTDRLKIELPSFETSAPLPSVPVTPQLSADTADEGRRATSQMSQMSESEMSSGGERSSILKTLTGLWALRAGDYTPLEYPLYVF